MMNDDTARSIFFWGVGGEGEIIFYALGEIKNG